MINISEIDYKKNIFDIIRLFAAFQVVFGHSVVHLELNNYVFLSKLQYISNYIPGRGVITLFFLSGFFSVQSIKKEISFSTYMKKKVNRLYPEMWMSFMLNILFILVTYDFSKRIIDWLVFICTQMTMFQFFTGGWLRGYGCGSPNGSLWTITVIMQFYICVYVLTKIIKKRYIWGILYVLSALISLITSNISFFSDNNLITAKLYAVSLIPYLHIFLLGIIVWNYKDKLVYLSKKYLVVLFFVYILVRYFITEHIPINLGYNYDIISSSVFGLLLLGVGFLGNIRLKVEFSYSVYLYHMLFINLFIQICNNNNLSIQKYNITFLLLTLLLTTIVSILSTMTIKKIKIFK